ncbi:MAG: transcriptional regulator [Nevskia sp.]|nr:transcriptional regulator [Nevskia sp.]
METKIAIAALAALAQETRLAVFRYLVEAGPQGVTVGRIGEALDVAPATLSFHLKELSRAGLITSRQESRFIWYSANYESMNALIAYLTDNCCQGQACGVAGAAQAKPKSTRRKTAAARKKRPSR